MTEGPTGPFYKIFVTGGVNGNQSGASGLDTYCASEASSGMISGTFKAMVGTNTRRACSTDNCSGGASENLDWVLKPNTSYVNENDNYIGTTNSKGIFEGSLSDSFGISTFPVRTGLTTTWKVSSNNCSNFASSSGSVNSSLGDQAANDSTAWANGSTSTCTGTYPVYCVEQ